MSNGDSITGLQLNDLDDRDHRIHIERECCLGLALVYI